MTMQYLEHYTKGLGISDLSRLWGIYYKLGTSYPLILWLPTQEYYLKWALQPLYATGSPKLFVCLLSYLKVSKHYKIGLF